jgi:hypothetical protein
MAPSLTIPTIHLNGTSGPVLRDGYASAYDAIDAAIEALAKAECNGRDYYPQGLDAYHQAREERDQAFEDLYKVRDYIGQVLTGICDQM